MQALRRASPRATNDFVTTVSGKGALPAQGEGFASAWREVRANNDIQFSQIEMPEPEQPPDWLMDFIQWLTEMLTPVGTVLIRIWPFLMWLLIALVVLGVAYLLYGAISSRSGRGKKAKGETVDWVPEEREALALLEEADRLAAAGNYDEATHLLLKRSVGQIAEARPDLVEPSSTARELAAEPRLPEAARNAFALIAAPVERSLFALVRLNEQDWQGARTAYADFALAQKAIAA